MPLQDPAALPAGLNVLQLPGWLGSGAAHWQSRWEALHGDRRVQQHDWQWPLRGDWMAQLDAAVADLQAEQGPDAPVALVAHSLGGQLVAAWATHSRRTAAVRAALLVAPPDLARPGTPPQLHSFTPMVLQRLPFPAMVVASRDDPFCSFERAGELAAAWGCGLLDAGPRGHLNAESGLGDWPEGRRLLAGLLAG